jgi:hypothetical protein
VRLAQEDRVRAKGGGTDAGRDRAVERGSFGRVTVACEHLDEIAERDQLWRPHAGLLPLRDDPKG